MHPLAFAPALPFVLTVRPCALQAAPILLQIPPGGELPAGQEGDRVPLPAPRNAAWGDVEGGANAAGPGA